MLRKLVLTVVLLVVLGGTAGQTAQAHNLRLPKSKQPVVMFNYWQAEHAHAWYALHWLNKHPWSSISWPIAYIDHRWLLEHSLTQERKWFLKTVPPHYYGWLCIHSKEGRWYSDTGNGYYHGLQMHWDWGYGIYGNPNNYTPMEIMWGAERGYVASGYSHIWLAGQWPHTYPPCARYF